MIYEIRVYEPAEGRAEAMRARFEREVVPRFFPRHGIEVLGVFTSPGVGELTYITRFADEEARQRAWAAFGADPEWKTVKAKSEVDGPLLREQKISVLAPSVAGLLLS